MLKIEKFVTASPEQMEMIIEGMRNPMNSWDRSDSYRYSGKGPTLEEAGLIDPLLGCDYGFELGPNDHELMMSLAKGGPVHAKYRRMMPIFVTITAPLYWWKEFDTYKVGTVANSCSTMHKIHAKEFTLEDFSHEHMYPRTLERLRDDIEELNFWRDVYLNGGIVDGMDGQLEVIPKRSKRAWLQMIQLLGTNYNQTRTVLLNYEVAHAMRKDRRFHKLGEWHVLCDFFESLPYSEVSAPEG